MKSRMQWGMCRRSKISKKASGCNSIEGMVRLKRAEAINEKVRTDEFNLDEMSTTAILTYADLNSHQLRDRVFDMIKKAIVTDINPLTGNPLDCKGVTRPLVLDMIELAENGKITEKPKSRLFLTQKEIGILDNMRIHSLQSCKTEEDKHDIVAVYKKIRGLA